ncbi:hypothetical protein ABZ330_20240 [Streptomyces sp. NPDC006172]|uniref:hypothetical protein n=1 Tax=Streptomyces sp. NPDC006172 TaxID=3154470 RepID=UPI0033E0184F
MPFPPPPRTLSGPRRRTLLATAAGTALLMSCSAAGDSGEESPDGSPSATERARARAARDSAELAARYDAVLAAHPGLAKRLTPLRAEVVRHTEAFGGAATAPGTPETSGAASPGAASASASPSGASASGAAASGRPAPTASASVPANEKDALAGLAAAERTLADSRVAALADVPGELARLLASVAAAGAAHAYLLTEGTR